MAGQERERLAATVRTVRGRVRRSQDRKQRIAETNTKTMLIAPILVLSLSRESRTSSKRSRAYEK